MTFDCNKTVETAEARPGSVQRLVMPSRPRLLDLFCCEGGAGEGYRRAGFDVTGVDNQPQPRNPHRFILADALEYLRGHGHEYDVIHASPPCQRYSWATPNGHHENHPDLITATRTALQEIGKPYIIENVGGARRVLRNPVKLCGSMFGLQTYRHRYFEIWPSFLLSPGCNHNFRPLLVTTAGANSRAIRGDKPKSVKNAPMAYGIEWMSCEGLKQAIPPAYTEWIGRELLRVTARHNVRAEPPPDRAASLANRSASGGWLQRPCSAF